MAIDHKHRWKIMGEGNRDSAYRAVCRDPECTGELDEDGVRAVMAGDEPRLVSEDYMFTVTRRNVWTYTWEETFVEVQAASHDQATIRVRHEQSKHPPEIPAHAKLEKMGVWSSNAEEIEVDDRD